jgi:signal transduction histidine kinase
MARRDRSAVADIVLAIVAVAVAIAALTAIPSADAPLTYRQQSSAAAVLGAVVGIGLMAAALLPGAPARRLLLVLAIVWFAGDLEAIPDSASLPRALATGTSLFAVAVALHLVLAFPAGLRTRGDRAVAAAGYLVAAAVGAGTIAFRDPFLDVYCWRQCSANPLLVHANPEVAHGLATAGRLSAIALAAAALAVAAHRLVAAGPAGRIRLAPVLVPAAAVALTEAARGVALLAVPLEVPGRPGFLALYLMRAAAIIALALGVTWTVARGLRVRSRVARLTAELGAAPAPGQLKAVLSTVLGDPGVEVLYWISGAGTFVDAEGAPRTEPRGSTTRITRGGRLLAVVVHDAATLPAGELERRLRPAARLAIENEALRAEVLAQLRQLRESRARIVATADESRRRLERDLHDGAQQRLLSVVLDLRLARSGAEPGVAERLEHVADEVDRAFNELRELAHGIYPAVLTEAGLEGAILTLADVAPLPVVVERLTQRRFDSTIEAGAYVTAGEAVRDAAARGAKTTRLSAEVDGEHLVITAVDDGRPRADPLVHVADRVGALGGALELHATTLRAEIPCA